MALLKQTNVHICPSQVFKIKIDCGNYLITSSKIYIFVDNSNRNQVKKLKNKKNYSRLNFEAFAENCDSSAFGQIIKGKSGRSHENRCHFV